MKTATISALKPAEALLRQRLDFPTWLPAMLVKELRQGLRARGFVGSLVAFQVIMTLFTIFAIAGGSGSATFSTLQAAFWMVLTVQLLVITPGRALAGLQAELEARSVDLLLLTRLTGWRIVLGKWISLLVQAALLVLAMLPYGVARYFFGSVDLAGEAKLIALLFGGSAVLTAAALWSSAMPKIGRVAIALAIAGLWGQANLGSVATALTTGRPLRGGPTTFGFSGPLLWLVIFDGAIVLAVCLIGAVRKLAPAAENQAPLLRLLPVVAVFPAFFVGLRYGPGQFVIAAILFAFIAALELARAEEPMAGQWREWARRGAWGRALGRFVQPGWASALEWVLLVATVVALAGLGTAERWRVARLALLAAEGLVFPALLLTWMSSQFTQRAAGYVLVLGGASLIAAVGAASASAALIHAWADITLLLLPISSFWASLPTTNAPPPFVTAGQVIVAVAVLGTAWWRARPYREQRREFAVEPAAVPIAAVTS